MEKGDSPSPAPSNTLSQADDVLHDGFQQLIQHNAAATPYTQLEQHPIDMGSHIGSNPHSRYSSPAPQMNMAAAYEHHSQASPYTNSQYVGGYHTAYSLDPSPYPQLPDVGSATNSHNAYSTPATSPPTPVQVDGITTRSGRAIMRPATASTVARAARAQPPSRARPKKRKREIGDDGAAEQSGIALAEPLSQLVRNITNTVDTDIEAYVNRSPEERQDEVAQSKTGKVKRPMNAFMLYRKAYQNRTKEWKRLDDIRRKEERAGEGKPEKGHDNHQVISQVCGLSWNMEPQDLRDQYDEWAKIERNNHKLAFPDYKFAPAKSKIKKPVVGSSGSRHGDRESDDDNASNLDAYDIREWPHLHSGPPSRNATRSTDFGLPPGYSHSVYTSPSPGVQAAHLPSAYVSQVPTMHQSPHPSSYQFSNPGKPRPAEYGSALGPGQYYTQNSEFTQPTYPHHYGGNAAYGVQHPGAPAFIENVFINKTNSPGSSFHDSPVLDQHGYGEMMVPSTYAPHISHPHTAMPHPQAHHLSRHPAEHHIDPSLMPSRQEMGGMVHEPTYDGLGILGLGHSGEFAPEGLPTYHLDRGVGGLGRSHTGSPHPQQFEQAFHTPKDTTPVAEGGNDQAPQGTEPSWHDGSGTFTDTKAGSSDWQTTLGGVGEFEMDDIDRILETTDSSIG